MYRYPGIQPFTQDQQQIFMGRNVEKRELLNLIKIYPLTVLFAKSGIGKSSLIQAGVQPELGANKIIPVFIRLNLEELSPEEQFYNHLVEQGFLSSDTPKNLTLWEYVKKSRFVKHGNYFTPLIIFDQFEELFTSYSAARRIEFVKQFADLANGTIPKGWRDSLESRKAEIHPTQYEKMLAPLNVKILLALRSDMLHYLEGLTDFVPGIFRVLYELQPLNEANAKEAITLPAAVVDEHYATPPFSYSPDALQEIIDFLQKKTDNTNTTEQAQNVTIECSNLQVVCQHIEKLVTIGRNNGTTITEVTPKLYAGHHGLEQIIDDFYQRTIEQFPEERHMAIRDTVERGLMKNERRLSMEKNYLIDQFGITAEELKELVNDRLLRKEPRMGSDYYEISHDTLIAPINRSFLIRKQREERLQEAETERAAAQAQAERNRKRNRTVVSILGVIGIILAVYASYQTYRAQQQTNIAQEQTEVAETARAQAEKDKASAIAAANDAIKAERKAHEANIIALQQIARADSLQNAISVERNIAKAKAYMANNGFRIAYDVLRKTKNDTKLTTNMSDAKKEEIQKLFLLCAKNL